MSHIRVSWIGMLLLAIMLLAMSSCTRQRPAAEPQASWTPSADFVPAAIEADEPEEAEAANDEETNGTPLPTSPARSLTPTPEATTEAEAPPTAPEYAEYTVVAGDTLFSIALRYDTDVDTIRRLNMIPGDEIYVGQILRVPARGEGAPTPTPEPLIHVVQAGETLFSIATRYGLTTQDVARANNIRDVNTIYVGQRLLIPGAAAQPPPAAQRIVHVVKPGESLLGIAVQYGVTVNQLVRANNLTNPDQIRIGQELIIPQQ